jgi:hypothetical protein
MVKVKDKDKEEGGRGKFQKPTEKEVSDFCKENNLAVNASDWINYWTSRGWLMKPGITMKDWKAALRNYAKMFNKGSAQPKPDQYSGGLAYARTLGPSPFEEEF